MTKPPYVYFYFLLFCFFYSTENRPYPVSLFPKRENRSTSRQKATILSTFKGTFDCTQQSFFSGWHKRVGPLYGRYRWQASVIGIANSSVGIHRQQSPHLCSNPKIVTFSVGDTFLFKWCLNTRTNNKNPNIPTTTNPFLILSTS
jgi:hypothetical protein